MTGHAGEDAEKVKHLFTLVGVQTLLQNLVQRFLKTQLYHSRTST